MNQPKVSTEAYELTLREGDYVFYPGHGVCRYDGYEEIQSEFVSGKTHNFSLVTKTGSAVKVQDSKLNESGLRSIHTKAEIEQAFDVLKKAQTERAASRSMWTRRAARYEQLLQSADLRDIAEVIQECLGKTLDDKEISYSERVILERGIEIMAPILQVRFGLGHDKAVKHINNAVLVAKDPGISHLEESDTAPTEDFAFGYEPLRKPSPSKPTPPPSPPSDKGVGASARKKRDGRSKPILPQNSDVFDELSEELPGTPQVRTVFNFAARTLENPEDLKIAAKLWLVKRGYRTSHEAMREELDIDQETYVKRLTEIHKKLKTAADAEDLRAFQNVKFPIPEILSDIKDETTDKVETPSDDVESSGATDQVVDGAPPAQARFLRAPRRGENGANDTGVLRLDDSTVDADLVLVQDMGGNIKLFEGDDTTAFVVEVPTEELKRQGGVRLSISFSTTDKDANLSVRGKWVPHPNQKTNDIT